MFLIAEHSRVDALYTQELFLANLPWPSLVHRSLGGKTAEYRVRVHACTLSFSGDSYSLVPPCITDDPINDKG